MKSLWDASVLPDGSIQGEFHGHDSSIHLAALNAGSTMPGILEGLRGRSVLIASDDQLPTAVGLLELDGVARRMVLCTPELTGAQLAVVAKMAQADAILVSDPPKTEFKGLPRITIARQPIAVRLERRATENTEWILLTSGTTDTPKLVVHSLQSLAGMLPRREASVSRRVWSTFYDIRRYGGLQIYLRALLSGSPLVLSSATATEPIGDFLARAGAARVTHISGTPSHWRRALMSGAATLIDPEYVRLSGEVADRPILDSLKETYPNAKIAHAFASTEAGVGFDVEDGLAGFPDSFANRPTSTAPGEIELKVVDGTLRIRSQRIGARYLGNESAALADREGFIDTGDLVELVGNRYYFCGRRGGVINVGGLKVYPEEIEAVLNADPRVRMSLVRSRPNPITGAVAVADVVLSSGALSPSDAAQTEHVTRELLSACRRALPAHKVPAVLRFVPSLEVTQAGKLKRPNA